MKNVGRWARSLSFAATLLISGGAGAAAPTPPPAPKKPEPQATEWPRTIPLGETKVLLGAPEAESLEGTKLKARGPAELRDPGGKAPCFGTVWYDADVEINRSRRLVTLVSVHVSRVELEGIPPARQQRLATRLGQVATRLRLRLPLDDVLAGAKLARRREEKPPKLGTEPPRILFETEPAILILFDGEPRFRGVESTRLERALNTPFLVLHDPGAGAYYLDGGTSWFRAPDPTGPWTAAEDVPAEAIQLARRDRDEAGVSDGDVAQARKSAEKQALKILVAKEPTELIVSAGPPEWGPVVEGELDTMSNTESDVFRTVPDRRYWLVLSGRWYRGEALNGPWTYVEPDQLPGSFRKIPASSAKADVLAFVPGTGPAREALRDANTPRTAAIRRSDAHVNVTYDGDPRFEPVPGTRVEYALNSPDQVLRIHGRYFVCDQGVWFTASAPTGPWRVADAIPDDEIQAIPPESPVYDTRFVTVYDATPETVYVAYTPAYLGSYPWYGTVVFGTGFYYRPWWGAFYYPRPWTWGFYARYAPWGGWGWGFGWGPAWAGFRFGFGFGWGARWCGPGGFYRPFYRNVNVTRNVTVNRNVNVTRNVYTAGANTTRASTTKAATSQAAAGKSGGAPKAGAKSAGAGQNRGKANPAKAKAGARTRGKAEGGKKPHG